MSRSLLAPAFTLLVLIGSSTAWGNPPFTLDGKTWKSQRVFVERARGDCPTSGA
jgi:hypothetical protein